MTHTYMKTVAGKSARGITKDMSVSTKVAIEVCNYLRGKELDRALIILEEVKKKTHAIPYRKYTDGVGHKPGNMGAGRFPVKAASEFIVLLKSIKANASNQGMSGNLIINHIAANRASRPMRNRAKYRGEFKRTHVEVIVVEGKAKSTKKSSGKKAVEEKKTASAKDEKSKKETPSAKPKVEEKKPEPKVPEKKPVAESSKGTQENKVSSVKEPSVPQTPVETKKESQSAETKEENKE